MEDIGNIIFYVILGIIALAGSIQGKGKKKPSSMPGPVKRRPEAADQRSAGRSTSTVTGRETRPVTPATATVTGREQKPAQPSARRVEPSPWWMPSDDDMEGRYDEPMAAEFEQEGDTDNPLAGAFSSEGSKRGGIAEAFASEGSMINSMATAFSGEGTSSSGESSIGGFVHNEISDSEIGDAPDFDYDSTSGQEIHGGGFNLRKAVIYTVILDRKEYSY